MSFYQIPTCLAHIAQSPLYHPTPTRPRAAVTLRKADDFGVISIFLQIKRSVSYR